MKVTHNISEYINKNQLRLSIHWKFVKNKHQYRDHITGKWHDAGSFNIRYPKYQYKPFNPKGINKDTTSFAD